MAEPKRRKSQFRNYAETALGTAPEDHAKRLLIASKILGGGRQGRSMQEGADIQESVRGSIPGETSGTYSPAGGTAEKPAATKPQEIRRRALTLDTSTQPTKPSMSKERVKSLQRAFNAAGFRDSNGHRLKVDGIIGPLTEASVQKALRSIPTITPDSSKKEIKAAQAALRANGVTDAKGRSIRVDGVIGPRTKEAIEKVEALTELAAPELRPPETLTTEEESAAGSPPAPAPKEDRTTRLKEDRVTRDQSLKNAPTEQDIFGPPLGVAPTIPIGSFNPPGELDLSRIKTPPEVISGPGAPAPLAAVPTPKESLAPAVAPAPTVISPTQETPQSLASVPAPEPLDPKEMERRVAQAVTEAPTEAPSVAAVPMSKWDARQGERRGLHSALEQYKREDTQRNIDAETRDAKDLAEAARRARESAAPVPQQTPQRAPMPGPTTGPAGPAPFQDPVEAARVAIEVRRAENNRALDLQQQELDAKVRAAQPGAPQQAPQPGGIGSDARFSPEAPESTIGSFSPPPEIAPDPHILEGKIILPGQAIGAENPYVSTGQTNPNAIAQQPPSITNLDTRNLGHPYLQNIPRPEDLGSIFGTYDTSADLQHEVTPNLATGPFNVHANAPFLAGQFSPSIYTPVTGNPRELSRERLWGGVPTSLESHLPPHTLSEAEIRDAERRDAGLPTPAPEAAPRAPSESQTIGMRNATLNTAPLPQAPYGMVMPDNPTRRPGEPVGMTIHGSRILDDSTKKDMANAIAYKATSTFGGVGSLFDPAAIVSEPDPAAPAPAEAPAPVSNAPQDAAKDTLRAAVAAADALKANNPPPAPVPVSATAPTVGFATPSTSTLATPAAAMTGFGGIGLGDLSLAPTPGTVPPAPAPAPAATDLVAAPAPETPAPVPAPNLEVVEHPPPPPYQGPPQEVKKLKVAGVDDKGGLEKAWDGVKSVISGGPAAIKQAIENAPKNFQKELEQRAHNFVNNVTHPGHYLQNIIRTFAAPLPFRGLMSNQAPPAFLGTSAYGTGGGFGYGVGGNWTGNNSGFRGAPGSPSNWGGSLGSGGGQYGGGFGAGGGWGGGGTYGGVGGSNINQGVGGAFRNR